MSKHILVVVTNPTSGNEDEYNRWYTNQHLGDVLKVPGFVAAQRFKVQRPDPNNPLGGPYLAIYEVDAESPDAAMDALFKASDSGAMVMSDALDMKSVSASMFTPISARVTR